MPLNLSLLKFWSRGPQYIHLIKEGKGSLSQMMNKMMIMMMMKTNRMRRMTMRMPLRNLIERR
jgi:hypothetical protein